MNVAMGIESGGHRPGSRRSDAACSRRRAVKQAVPATSVAHTRKGPACAPYGPIVGTVRASGVLRSAEGYGRYDHLCLAYDHATEFALKARDFLADGLAQGLQVHCVLNETGRNNGAGWSVGSTGSWLLNELAPSRQDALQVTSLGETYGVDHVVSASEQIALYAEATAAALAAGFTGFRVAADVTPIVTTPVQLNAFVHYEHLIDRHMSRFPMSAMCAYDRTVLGADAVAQLACMHPVSNVDTMFRWHAAEVRDQDHSGTPPNLDTAVGVASVSRGPGVEIVEVLLNGEVDRSSRDLFRAALDRTDVLPGQPVVVNAAGLNFVDHHALAALDDFARRHDTRIAVQNAGYAVEQIAEFMDFEHVTVVGAA